MCDSALSTVKTATVFNKSLSIGLGGQGYSDGHGSLGPKIFRTAEYGKGLDWAHDIPGVKPSFNSFEGEDFGFLREEKFCGEVSRWFHNQVPTLGPLDPAEHCFFGRRQGTRNCAVQLEQISPSGGVIRLQVKADDDPSNLRNSWMSVVWRRVGRGRRRRVAFGRFTNQGDGGRGIVEVIGGYSRWGGGVVRVKGYVVCEGLDNLQYMRGIGQCRGGVGQRDHDEG
ncbi:hypothetical protein DFH07DRAFT_784557 [Mycena maculata]|uniref:Uncharacterized protein n=1 Tax=Mycena maculata TaxID=230809 RepID=A0AAD7MJY1_9AGAR|nr:hypothetical protein DFH07DRAFT_784557 [Mycena maculata]